MGTHTPGEGFGDAQRAKRFRVQLGTQVAPIDDEEWANCCMLYWLMPARRQREFWQLRGGKATKQAFLLRWGHFEQARAKQ